MMDPDELAYLLACVAMLAGVAGFGHAGALVPYAGCFGGLGLAMSAAWRSGGNGPTVVLAALALAAVALLGAAASARSPEAE